MEASSLAEHIRDEAVKHLTERGNPITPEAIEEQGKWLIALYYAASMSDGMTQKDLAHLFLEGLKPIVSIDEECKNLTDEDLDECQGEAVTTFINGL